MAQAFILSERLQKLLADTNRPDPYPVTEVLVVTKPSKKRSDGMRESQVDIGVTNALLQQAIARSMPARPEYPAPPDPPDKGAPKAVAAYDKAAAAWKTLVEEWVNLHEAWEQEVERNSEKLRALGDRYKESQAAYWRELFGSAHDEIMAIFDDLPPEDFDLFAIDVQQHFGLIAKPQQLPDDGSCPECGHLDDAEQAGKAPKSSTSSKTTGAQSNATSAVEDSTPVTGSAA